MMDRDLFLAILSMDAYNRGYGAGLKNLPSSGALGRAVIKDISLPKGSEAVGFYAIAYDVSGLGLDDLTGTVISYRGTDANLVNLFGDEGSDLINGYGLATGNFLSPQARLAAGFYNAVIGSSDQFSNNVTTTGHSLGGGLAASRVH